MTHINRSRLNLETLDDRIVPATLNLTTVGSAGYLNTAHFSQLNPGQLGSDPTHTFLRLQESSILGSILTPEEGYNTTARPLQYDATGNTTITRSLQLSEVPLVTKDGIQYREFLMTVNQPTWSPNIDLQELRIFLSENNQLTGYNTNTDQLAGLLPAYNLDAAGNHTVRVNDNLNRTGSADVRVLIPGSAFAGASGTTSVYLYSKFSALVGTTVLSGAESWSVGTPPPTSTLGSISGRVVDANGVGVGGISVTLSGIVNGETAIFGVDNDGNPITDWTVTTNSDGSFSFGDLEAGTYFVSVTEQSPYEADAAILGTSTDPLTFEGDNSNPNSFLGIDLSSGETATDYTFRFILGDS